MSSRRKYPLILLVAVSATFLWVAGGAVVADDDDDDDNDVLFYSVGSGGF